MTQLIGTIFVAALGLCFGSFLNVCLSRWPAGESIVRPGSHCRNCSHALAWWENIPLLSWVLLRGRCRQCRAWIGWRYPLVELAVAALWAILAARFFDLVAYEGLEGNFLYYELGKAVGKMAFCWLLVALVTLDAEHFWLPNFLTIPGAALGFCFTILDPVFSRISPIFALSWRMEDAAVSSLIGILIAAAIPLLIRWLYWLIRRKEGLGLGDAKLMAMLAAWLGLPGALLAFFIGVVLAAAAALFLLAQPKQTTDAGQPAESNKEEKWAMKKLPLGSFLCIGAIVSSLWDHQLIAAYLHWAGF